MHLFLPPRAWTAVAVMLAMLAQSLGPAAVACGCGMDKVEAKHSCCHPAAKSSRSVCCGTTGSCCDSNDGRCQIANPHDACGCRAGSHAAPVSTTETQRGDESASMVVSAEHLDANTLVLDGRANPFRDLLKAGTAFTPPTAQVLYCVWRT